MPRHVLFVQQGPSCLFFSGGRGVQAFHVVISPSHPIKRWGARAQKRHRNRGFLPTSGTHQKKKKCHEHLFSLEWESYFLPTQTNCPHAKPITVSRFFLFHRRGGEWKIYLCTWVLKVDSLKPGRFGRRAALDPNIPGQLGHNEDSHFEEQSQRDGSPVWGSLQNLRRLWLSIFVRLGFICEMRMQIIFSMCEDELARQNIQFSPILRTQRGKKKPRLCAADSTAVGLWGRLYCCIDIRETAPFVLTASTSVQNVSIFSFSKSQLSGRTDNFIVFPFSNPVLKASDLFTKKSIYKYINRLWEEKKKPSKTLRTVVSSLATSNLSQIYDMSPF